MTTRSENSDAHTNATGAAHPAAGSRKLALAGAKGDETTDIPTPCPSGILIAVYSIREGT